MKKAVIFDLDGTLLNTLDDLAASVNFALESNGYSPRTIDEVRQFVGNGIRLLMCRALPGGEDNADFSKVFESLLGFVNDPIDEANILITESKISVL